MLLPHGGALPESHIPIVRSHAARFHERHISSVTFTSAHLCGNVYRRVGIVRALAVSSDFCAPGGAKLTKMGDSLPGTPMSRRAKVDAASFIIGGEIRNRTKNTQTLNGISTPCLSACVDNKGNQAI